MTVTSEELMAYADGELEGADKARVEAALADAPDLQARVEKHRALRGSLAVAYAPVLDEPVPARLVNAAKAAPVVDNVVPIGAARARRPWGVREWGAMAASLVVGLLVGAQALRPDAGPIVASDGALEARGALARALDTQLAADNGAVRIGVTFRTQAGETCRTFAADAGALNGLACHEDARWRVDMAMRGEARPATEFSTAGSETPAAVLSRVEALIAGDPLDAAAEKAARDRRWK